MFLAGFVIGAFVMFCVVFGLALMHAASKS